MYNILMYNIHTHTHTHTLSLSLSLSQIAGVNYGGHVTDDFDRRVLYTYIAEMFKDEVLEQPYYKYIYIYVQTYMLHIRISFVCTYIQWNLSNPDTIGVSQIVRCL